MEEHYLRQSEGKLAEACANGDASACKELYDRYSPRMWSLCLRYGQNRMIAEDMFQEGFVRVYEKIGSYLGQGSLEGWIRRIMVNSAINFLEKHKRHITEPESSSASEASQAPGTIEQLSAEEMTRMIQRLPDNYRIVFNMFAIEGYSHREISELLGVSENTSKSRMLRARQILQQMIRTKGEKEKVYERSRI